VGWIPETSGPVSAGSGDAELIGGRAIILDRNELESGQGTGRLPQKLPATSPIEVVQWTDDASILGFDRSASVLSDRRVRLAADAWAHPGPHQRTPQSESIHCPDCRRPGVLRDTDSGWAHQRDCRG
jgi:hypothetical protein